MKPKIKVAFASGTDELNERLIERMRGTFPDLPLYVVSEFPPAGKDVRWIRYRGGFFENLARCRAAFREKSIRLAGVLLVPNVPFRRMRLLALVLSPFYFLAVNENLNDFMLRPGSLPAILKHVFWRMSNFVRWHLSGDRPAVASSASAAPPPDEAVVYPGKPAAGKPRALIASAYVPFPLSHGGAVRIHNLTLRAAEHWDQVLLCFTETGEPPARELLDRFVEIVFVRRAGSHLTADRGRPEVVAQFDSLVFRNSLRESIRKWKPAVTQLEFTHMAQYASDCAPVPTILVEHDITFDLYRQMAEKDSDWDLHRQLKRWERFETAAWRDVSCVVAMSPKDQGMIHGCRSVILPNGVDLDRFTVSPNTPEPRRLLFIGSFSHLPNIMALRFFLEQAWPALQNTRLHIIAGANHAYFLDFHRQQVSLNLNQPGIEIEGFVPDVRSAYARAQVVIAPLVASAGTNLKVLEAMACGRPVVSTPAGVNGLELTPGTDFVLVHTGAEMADAIERLFQSPEACAALAAAARRRVEHSYGWDAIARRQDELYRELARN
ncbi:MAG TPA: glycosyltransferase family 4 protein [Bryobacteraceae bacterium]|nr:glycosyltransferase family 4 protein [Bryobacteraceae bacterium]